MHNPTHTVAAKLPVWLYEKLEMALFTGENKQHFLVAAIERELVRRAVHHEKDIRA
jgi:hypothetical protein